MFRTEMRRLANMRAANRAANRRQNKKMIDIFLPFDDHISFRFITTLWLLCAATGIGGKGQLLLLLSVLTSTVSSLSFSESARLKILYKMRWQMRPLHQGAKDLGTLKQIIFVLIPLSLFWLFTAQGNCDKTLKLKILWISRIYEMYRNVIERFDATQNRWRSPIWIQIQESRIEVIFTDFRDGHLS